MQTDFDGLKPGEGIIEKYSEAKFDRGEKAEFIGVFTHTETILAMDEQLASLRRVLYENPYITGITIKLPWRNFHPEKDVVNWDKLENLIDAAALKGKIINFVLLTGFSTPEWVYAEGAENIGPVAVGGSKGITPILWDPVYIKYYSEDLKLIAREYANDQRLSSIEIQGHNYKSEEMHTCDPQLLGGFGYSRAKVAESWKSWIDLYGQLFSDKKLILVVSQMYSDLLQLPLEVAEYFVEKYRGRAILQTDQLNGREELRTASGEICRKFCNSVPNSHEMVGSFLEQPDRQGTAEMTVYNFKKLGNPLYLQLWRRDCNNPQYAKDLLEVYEKYKDVDAAVMKKDLQSKGLYVEVSTWTPGTLK